MRLSSLVFFPVYVFPCLLVCLCPFIPIPPYQLPLPLPLHLLDGAFAFHCRSAIRLFLHIHQFHRQPHPRVLRAASLVVDGDALFGVNRPARVIRPIRAFDDVAKTARHLFFLLRENIFPRNIWLNFSPKVCFSVFSCGACVQSALARSLSHRSRDTTACSSRDVRS